MVESLLEVEATNFESFHLLSHHVLLQDLHADRVRLLLDNRGVYAALKQDLLKAVEALDSSATFEIVRLAQVPKVEVEVGLFFAHV